MAPTSPPAAWAARPALVGPRDLPDERLRQIERVLLVGLAVGGVIVLATQPAVRKLARQALRVGLTSWLPALVVREFGEAWRSAAVVPPTHEGV